MVPTVPIFPVKNIVEKELVALDRLSICSLAPLVVASVVDKCVKAEGVVVPIPNLS